MALIEYELHELLAYAGSSLFIIRKDFIMNKENRYTDAVDEILLKLCK